MNSRIVVLGLSFAYACCSGAAYAQDAATTQIEPAPANSQPFIDWSDSSLTLLPYGWGFEVDPEEQTMC